MIGALVYWRLTSLRNRTVAWVRRLRQPKYLVSCLAGVLYFYFFFLRRAHFRMPHTFAPAAAATIAGFLLMVTLFIQATLAWLAAGPEAQLPFSEAEIAFLFAAPLSRKRLIHFNLLSGQFTILLSSLLLTVIMNRWSFLAGNALTHAIGWWLILSTFSLFRSAMNFIASQAIATFGLGVKRRAYLLLGVLAAAAVRTLWQHAQSPAAMNLLTLPSDVVSFASGWLQASFGRIALTPFTVVVGPFAAPTTLRFAAALPLALIPAAVSYALLVWLQVPFREGSIRQAGSRAQVKAARAAGGGPRTSPIKKALRSPFALAPTGRPEVAFFWKNLIGIQSWFNLRLALVIAMVLTLMVSNLSRLHASASDRGSATMIAVFAAIAGFYVMLLGPQLIRQDLRSDLPNADLFKAYPLQGWQIVTGQMLTPALLLSFLLYLATLVLGWALLTMPGTDAMLAFGDRVTLLVCIAVLIPAVVLLQLVIPNAAALLFPAWHQNSRTRSAGIEAIGQRLIFTFGQFLAVVVALIPAALLAVLVAAATVHFIGWALCFVCAAAAAFVVVSGEVWVGLWWLGQRFERLDIAMELKS